MLFIRRMDFDCVGFGAGIEADGAARTSGARIEGVFHAFPVEAFGKGKALLGAGRDAAAASLALLCVDKGEGYDKFVVFVSHADRVPKKTGLSKSNAAISLGRPTD
jgi:hypothetical protein